MKELKEKILQRLQAFIDNYQYDINITYSDKNIFVNNIISLMDEYKNDHDNKINKLILENPVKYKELEFNDKICILQSYIPAKMNYKELMILLKSILKLLSLYLIFHDDIYETTTGRVFIKTSADLNDGFHHSITVWSVCEIPSSDDEVSKDQATSIAIEHARLKAITSLVNTNTNYENS